MAQIGSTLAGGKGGFQFLCSITSLNSSSS